MFLRTSDGTCIALPSPTAASFRSMMAGLSSASGALGTPSGRRWPWSRTSSVAVFSSTFCPPASTRFATTVCGLRPTASDYAASRMSLPRTSPGQLNRKRLNHPNLHGAHSLLKVKHVRIAVKVFSCGLLLFLDHPEDRPDSYGPHLLMSRDSDDAASSSRFFIAPPWRPCPPRRPLIVLRDVPEVDHPPPITPSDSIPSDLNTQSTPTATFASLSHSVCLAYKPPSHPRTPVQSNRPFAAAERRKNS